jgi:hypothetical protein
VPAGPGVAAAGRDGATLVAAALGADAGSDDGGVAEITVRGDGLAAGVSGAELVARAEQDASTRGVTVTTASPASDLSRRIS